MIIDAFFVLLALSSNHAGAASSSLSGASMDRVAISLPIRDRTWAQTAIPFVDGRYVGVGADAYYGIVQVQADIQNGQIVSVKVLKFPNDRTTSRYINSQALPVLQHEAITAQTGHVDVVSGATLTSNAFINSLSDALRQAVRSGPQTPSANAA